MRFIKLAIISFLLIAGAVTAISFLMPSRVVVSRAVDIHAPIDSIFKRVSSILEWKQWLQNRDTLPIVISKAEGADALTMGNTTVYISSVAPTQIKTKWRVRKGKAMPGFLNLIEKPNEQKVTVEWQFLQELGWYPWEKFSAIISDKVLGPFMEQSLANLKQTVETKSVL